MKKLTIFLAFLLFVGFQAAAQMQITGTVTDAEDGSSIPGVSIVVKGNTSIGTTTDMDGNYNLTVPGDAEVLVFSFIGMEKQEITIGGRSVIDVQLKPEVLEMGEVIVLGYNTKGKNAITGSTVQIESDAIRDVPVVSVDQTLQGKVAGLNISASSGTPGSVQDIRIRGMGSYSADNEPLFVIDGVPVVNNNQSGDAARSSLSSLASLNSNDIESITVLKDASATSAYGARGSNGVIVITTKKGKVGATKFNMSVFRGFQNKAYDGYDVLTGAQKEELILDQVFNTYGEAYTFDRGEAFDFADANGLLPGHYYDWDDLGRPDANWEEAMANENAPTTNISLSASGGDDISQFYASLGYNNTESIIKGSLFKRINGSLNYTRDLSETVKLSTNNSVSNTIQDGLPLEQSAYFANPMMGKYFMNSWYQPYDENGDASTNTGGLYNWLYLKDRDVTINDLTRVISNSYIEWEIIEGLKFKSLVSLDYLLTAFKEYQNRHYGDSEPENGTAFASDQKNFNFVSQNSLAYDFSIDDHNFSVMALLEYQENKFNYLWGYGENFATDGLTNIASAGANFDASSSYSDWKNASYLGMINYNFQGKYIADITYRREGSSRFAPGYRWGDFWSVGGAWNLSQEEFLAGVDIVDRLRIRASYGVSGNSGIGLNEYQALLGYAADYADAGAIYPSGFGNNLLTWEKNSNYDIGLDFGILNNRISGSFSYYNKRTYDLLQDVPLSRTSGFSTITQNVGEVENKGIEVLIDLGVVRTDDFNLDISFNFATVNNEVIELAKDGEGEYINIETGTRKLEVGHPIYEWNMREYAGVDPDNGLPMWYLNTEDAEEGETTYDYYEAEKTYLGASALPTYSGGASLNMNYKGIFLNASVYFAGGHKVYEDWAFYTHHSGLYTTSLYQGVDALMDRWQEPGDVTDVPRMEYNYVGNNASRTSTRFLYDGDYLRVKDLTLGYNLPDNLISQIGFDGVSIFVRGTNLFTWVKDEDLKHDPEVRADGFTRMTNPPIKSVSVGLNLNF
ncbi:MAG: TonB-dependent receptor [Bacteroidales bacterium]